MITVLLVIAFALVAAAAVVGGLLARKHWHDAGIRGEVIAGLSTGVPVALAILIVQVALEIRLNDLQRREQENAERQALQFALSTDDDLNGIDLSDRDMSGLQLRNKSLREAKLDGADLAEADLSGARLDGADLSGTDLRGANLQRAKLHPNPDRVFLVRSDLCGANAAELQAPDAIFNDANLRDASLQRANLRRAEFDGADLAGADLRGARLHGADLDSAKNLDRAGIRGARADAATRWPSGFRRSRGASRPRVSGCG